MKRVAPLRVRVTLLYTLMGLILSVMFAAAVAFIAEDYEHLLVDEILNSHAEDFSARMRVDPSTDLPQTRRLSGYLRTPDGRGEVPAELAALSPGIHESQNEQSDGVHFGVFDTVVGRLYFSIDLRGIEALEVNLARILIAVVVLGTLTSAWLGWLLAGVVVRPVRRLADAVAELPAVPFETAFAQNMAADELGRLGQAIDDYQRRLLAADSAERAFFADASHELRTPIAVVRGATELLLDEAVDYPSMQPRLARLDRGMRELSDLLDALLRLARRRIADPERVDLHVWLKQSLQGLPAVREGFVSLQIASEGTALLAKEELALVLTAVARHLLSAGVAGSLDVRANADQIRVQWVVRDSTTASSRGTRNAVNDRALGLTLIGRLATESGWLIDDRSEPGVVILSRRSG